MLPIIGSPLGPGGYRTRFRFVSRVNESTREMVTAIYKVDVMFHEVGREGGSDAFSVVIVSRFYGAFLTSSGCLNQRSASTFLINTIMSEDGRLDSTRI